MPFLRPAHVLLEAGQSLPQGAQLLADRLQRWRQIGVRRASARAARGTGPGHPREQGAPAGIDAYRREGGVPPLFGGRRGQCLLPLQAALLLPARTAAAARTRVVSRAARPTSRAPLSEPRAWSAASPA
ncbi:hypothetical protein [Streptomyces sp. SUK 48]|uniref:hypothetical protein n=1 Tax=Streptomyces sp. SUK 48 TaxID=2582831 RepID=UPI001891E55E|nr:hypothetical protein [Streptomyces sp. SUK 48]